MAKQFKASKPNERFPVRVQKAVNGWRKITQPVREARKRMLEQYANGFYGGGMGIRTPQPINLIDRGIQILAPYLVSKNPKVMIFPRANINNPNIKPFARTLELALAHLFDEIKLGQDTLRPIAIDSLFMMGIAKTGTAHSHEVEIGGYLHDAGQPYSDRVDFDDYIGDSTARNRQEMKLEGNVYRLPEEYVKTSGYFKNYDNVAPDMPLYGYNTNPDLITREGNNHRAHAELKKSVELQDIWLPDEGVIITIPLEGQGNKIMRTVEWDGPEGGPYDVLGYRYFPNSVIPIPPVYVWLDVNKAINELVSKMQRQASRQKNLGIYNLSNAEVAERIKNAADGDMVGVPNLDDVKELALGGWNDQNMPFIQYLEQQYSIGSFNLYTLGGRGPQAKTLGQEQMLMSNASRALDDMVFQMYNFTKSITRKLAWFLWSDPLIVLPLVRKVAGQNLQVEYSDATKEGDFFDYTFDIEPHSMSRMNPEMRWQRLMQLISGIVLPTAQIAAAQGSMLNVDALVKESARYLGINNVSDWWNTEVPQVPGMNPYQPEQGTVKSGQASGQTTKGQKGLDNFSNMNNLNQQQTRAAGKSTGSTGGT
jgi:hypothetical protein